MVSGRFFPPGVRREQHLFREDLVSFGRSVLAESGRLAAIAPAGQGKSQFGAQVASEGRVLWLSCDGADADPSVLATDLLLAAGAALSSWKGQGLRTRAQRAELLLEGPLGFVRAFYASLADQAPDLLVVMDDLHLAAHPANQSLLEALAQERPLGIRLLWLSRSLPQPLAAGLSAGDFPRISMERLAMRPSEIQRLYASVYAIPISSEVAEDIHKATQGWTMGVVSVRRRLAEGEHIQAEACLDADLHRFFHDTFLGRLTGLRRSFVLCLSALERIPVSMVQDLAPDNTFPGLLQNLGEEGLFVQKTGSDTYAFHHLILDMLRQKRDSEEPLSVRRFLLGAMAAWHGERGLLTEALCCFAASGDGDGAETLMDAHFPDFLSLRQDARIARYLLAFDVSEEHPGLALGLAFFTLAEADPEKTAFFLHTAARGYARQKNPTGELRSLVLMIRRRLFGDLLYDAPDRLFLRMTELLDHPDLRLCFADDLLVALGWGQFAILHAFSRKMVQKRVAPVLVRGVPPALVSIQAELIAILTHGEAMTGRHRTALEISEQGHSLLQDPALSSWSLFCLRFARANTLGLCGMEAAFIQESRHILCLPRPLLDRTLALPFIRIREICFLIQRGRYREAEGLATARLQDPQVAAQPALTGEFLQYRAWALALLGEKDAALTVAAASEAAQAAGGNAFFQLMNLLMTGAVAALCGERAEAERKMEKVLDQQLVAEEICLREGAFWIRSFVRLQADPDTACGDLKEALYLSRIRNAPHFLFAPAWLPSVLSLAMERGIEGERVEALAREGLGLGFDARGKAFDLPEVRLLGGFALVCGERRMHAADLSPLHRSLLGLLILSPGHSMSVSGIQERLWPHVMAESARTSMDAALSRLRRVLGQHLGKGATACLGLNNGVLSLFPRSVDALSYLEEVAAAEKARLSGCPWMAEAHLAQAAALDRGAYSGEVLGLEEAGSLGEAVAEARRRLALWKEDLHPDGEAG